MRKILIQAYFSTPLPNLHQFLTQPTSLPNLYQFLTKYRIERYKKISRSRHYFQSLKSKFTSKCESYTSNKL